jgi:HK97 family phage prohead protease
MEKIKMGKKQYDFSGWATRNDLKCGDGRVIRKDAFKDNDGQIVPLVWNHQHNDPLNVLGHALLENRDEGVYAYCSFNDTDNAREVKKIVQHGDVAALSIYANKLKQHGADVIHGAIREVSLVLAGANPGAFIDAVLEHSDEEGDAMIYSYCSGENLSLVHSEEGEPDNEPEEGEDMGDNEEMSLEEIRDEYENMTDEQKEAVHYLIGQALEDAGVDFDDEDEEDDDDEDYDDEEDDDVEHSDIYEGDYAMKHNVFDYDAPQESNFLSHSDMQEIFRNAKRIGSFREAINEFTDNAGVELMHSTMSGDTEDQHAPGYDPTYGLKSLDYLFPDYKSLNVPPSFISRNMEWVSTVMGAVHHTPFSRIKSMFADITADEARAKGYIKGNMKKEEVFTLLKRTTDPQTVYKKQKMDRDDVTDITDFDVVAWIRREMRMMLDEEIARAILIGDGRLSDDQDKIDETHVRPIAKDADLYTIKV